MDINEHRFFDRGDGTILVVPEKKIERWISLPPNCTFFQNGNETQGEHEHLTSEGQLSWLDVEQVVREEVQNFLPYDWMNISTPLTPIEFFNNISHHGEESEEVAIYFNGSNYCGLMLDQLDELHIENAEFVKKEEIQFAREYIYSALVQFIFSATINGTPSQLTITESQFPGLNTAEIKSDGDEPWSAQNTKSVHSNLDYENLKKYRKLSRFSIEELAHIIRVSPELLLHYEHGDKNPKSKTLSALAQALDVPIVKLIKGDSPAEKTTEALEKTKQESQSDEDSLKSQMLMLQKEIFELKKEVTTGNQRIESLLNQIKASVVQP